jgi:hypothetical protein
MALRARVHNGRITLDEPTDLPEGAELDLVAMDADTLNAEERELLHASLDRALADSEAGRGVDVWEFLHAHRSQREDRVWGGVRGLGPDV